ncbi:MAG: hypothetical protein ACYC55_02950 [Candidatus Geothermincolia bacterium]
MNPTNPELQSRFRKLLDRCISRAAGYDQVDPYRLFVPCPFDESSMQDLWSMIALREAGEEACPAEWLHRFERMWWALYGEGCGSDLYSAVHKTIYGQEALHA